MAWYNVKDKQKFMQENDTTQGYLNMNNGTWLSQRSGIHSSGDQSPYASWSSALGRNFNVDEYVPYYHNWYMTSTAAGRAQMAADRAEAENVRRYYEILAGYKDMLNNSQNQLSSAYDAAASANLQNLTSRGLTGTTILSNVANKTNVAKAKAMNEDYNNRYNAMLDFMERRNTSTGDLL